MTMTTTTATRTIFLFDLLCGPEHYADVVKLYLRGGGGHAVDRHSLARRSNVRVGELLGFANADGVGSCALADVVGVTLVMAPTEAVNNDPKGA
jgi:hypothetical protein